MGRAGTVAAVLLLAGCGSAGASQTLPPTAETPQPNAVVTRCTAVSGGYRACTSFHSRGEISQIERRRGTRWSVLLSADLAPYPRPPSAHVGYWQRVLPDRGGTMLLAKWSAECGVPFTYLVTTRKPALRRVFRRPSSPLGWTSGGLARVRLLTPIPATRTSPGFPSGIYLVTRQGRVVRLERRTPPCRGC